VVIRTMWVLYDARCGICSRVRTWMQQQRSFVAVEFIPAGSERARSLFPELDHPDVPRELVVITDQGDVYLDDAAWILCLWALAEYRTWSFRFARGPLRPLARAAWDFLSANRHELARMLSLESDDELARRLADRKATTTCDIG
jgi:predicted DCC family thiol-disulfide oxidoreductase YuxK